MTLYVRRGTPSIWDGSDPTDDRLDQMRKQFTLREREPGITVWKSESDEDESLIIAALMCSSARMSSKAKPIVEAVHLLRIEERHVTQFGPLTPSEGDTPVPRANALHHELVWAQSTLHDLATFLGREIRLSVTRNGNAVVRKALCALQLEEVDDDVRDFLRAVQGQGAPATG